MAQNKNNQNQGCAVIAIIIGIILTVMIIIGYLAPIIIPVFFLIMSFVNYLLYNSNDKIWLDTGFWLTNNERNEFVTYKSILSRAIDTKSNIQDRINSGNVKLNADGSISRKSYAGKDARAAFENANYDINEAKPIVEDISARPYKRWKKARSHYTNAKALGVAFGVWIISLLISSLFISGSLVENFSLYFSEMGNNVSAVWDSEHDMTSNGFLNSLWTILVVSFLAYLIVKIIYQARFSSTVCKEPPIVTLDNVDTYIVKFRQQKATEEAIRRKQEERLERLKERERQAKEQKKAEKARAAEQKAKEVAVAKTTVVNVKEPDIPIAETAPSVPVAPMTEIPQRSREENLFISLADNLKKDGYEPTGNWENWKNAGQWKNMAVVSSVNDVRLRITVEYDAKSKKIYYGIAKFDGEDTVSQELLNNEKFRQIMSECGLSVANNEWWYCMKSASFDTVCQEYRHLMETVRKL